MAFKIKGLSGAALCKDYVIKCGHDTILAFSRGKDSIATALAIRDHLNVVPVFYYFVPDLPMVEESLDYFERTLFKRKILRYPDQRLYDWLDTGVHQTIRNMEIIDACNPSLPNPLHEEGGVVEFRTRRMRWIIEQDKIAPTSLIALGVTARDSPQRYMSFQKHGQIRPRAGSWYPIWDYDRAKLLGNLTKSLHHAQRPQREAQPMPATDGNGFQPSALRER